MTCKPRIYSHLYDTIIVSLGSGLSSVLLTGHSYFGFMTCVILVALICVKPLLSQALSQAYTEHVLGSQTIWPEKKKSRMQLLARIQSITLRILRAMVQGKSLPNKWTEKTSLIDRPNKQPHVFSTIRMWRGIRQEKILVNREDINMNLFLEKHCRHHISRLRSSSARPRRPSRRPRAASPKSPRSPGSTRSRGFATRTWGSSPPRSEMDRR